MLQMRGKRSANTCSLFIYKLVIQLAGTRATSSELFPSHAEVRLLFGAPKFDPLHERGQELALDSLCGGLNNFPTAVLTPFPRTQLNKKNIGLFDFISDQARQNFSCPVEVKLQRTLHPVLQRPSTAHTIHNYFQKLLDFRSQRD